MDSLRLESRLWGASLPARRLGRRGLELAADLKLRSASLLGRRPRARIRAVERDGDGPLPADAFLVHVDGRPDDVPAVTEEALILVAAAEGLDAVRAGAEAPALSEDPESPPASPFAGRTWMHLGRRRPTSCSSAILGKTVPILGTGSPAGEASAAPFPFDAVDGYWLPPGAAVGRVVRRPVGDAHDLLASLPVLDGPPTVIFVLPFLAVGGAERLLFDLLRDLVTKYRCLVVTLEPHRPHLGRTVDRCLELTPWVFTLGDWLPREAHFGALSHLVRRFGAKALFSWNGTVFFYDRVPDLRRRFPNLRMVHQLYHFEGGWTARTSPAVIRSVDVHVGVNGPIETSLVERLKVPRERTVMIHHGVPVPAKGSEDLRERRRRLRTELGIPPEAVVLGTFIRLHPQKRPLDVLALARRFPTADGGPWFLLMGGGPLDETVDRELRERPIPHLVRLPLQQEPLPFYDALDLCLMTSDYEGLPVFLLDGMVRGLPGIAPTVGDVPLLFEDGGGIASGPPGDLDALEKAVRALLDPSARRQAAERARRTVEQRFGLERYRKAYEDVLFGEETR